MRKIGQVWEPLRWLCFTIILTAVILRLVDFIPWGSVVPSLKQPTCPAVQMAKAPYPTLYYELPAKQPVPPSELTFAQVAVRNPTGMELDLSALMAQPIAFDLQADGPLILIVHTHATEAYTPSAGEEYEAEGDFRTLDTEHNVVRVGQAMADRLNENGIYTIHDTTLNDVPGYTDAYERMAEVIAGYLEQYPSIQMVIDVHRDSVAGKDGEEIPLTTQLEGDNAAQLLLVMGSDIAGLTHPNWRCNLGFALQLQAYCERSAPGLFRDLTLRTQRYNEHLTPHSILLEVGAAGNTLPEALRSGVFFADQLAELLKSQ